MFLDVSRCLQYIVYKSTLCELQKYTQTIYYCRLFVLHLLYTYVYCKSIQINKMKDRIKQIMDTENMTPARFADTLQIGRAVISHILNGRNNPSLDVITRILSKMPEINSDWLLTGTGAMFKDNRINTSDTNEQTSPSLPDLFTQLPSDNSVNSSIYTEKTEYRKEMEVDNTSKPIHKVINERIIYKEAQEKKIKQIIIYYTDNTFETFNSHQN